MLAARLRTAFQVRADEVAAVVWAALTHGAILMSYYLLRPVRDALVLDGDGEPVFTAPTVAAVLIFFVYALQCLSTVAVLRRESNSRRWAAVTFGSMFALAYGAAFIAHTIVAALD